MLDVGLRLIVGRGWGWGKKKCKMVLSFWRTRLEKNVGFALLKKSKELFLELAVKLSARGRGRRCQFCETSLPSLHKRGQTDRKLEFACAQQRLL